MVKDHGLIQDDMILIQNIINNTRKVAILRSLKNPVDPRRPTMVKRAWNEDMIITAYEALHNWMVTN